MKSAVLRFRSMAIIAGVMSLLLWFVDLPVAYLFDNPDWKESCMDSICPWMGLSGLCNNCDSICH